MDGTNDDNNDNTEEQSKNEAIWKLLSLYKDMFSSDEDYVEYARTVQRATGASDQMIDYAISFRNNNPYARKTRRPKNIANPWTVSAGEHKYNDSDKNKKHSGAGRPKGGTGGGPGGNMKHACKANPDKGGKNRRLGDYGIGSNQDDELGANAGVLVEDGNNIQLINEAEENKRRQVAHEALRVYANNYKNGSFEVEVDLSTEEDDDIDIDDGDDAGIFVEDAVDETQHENARNNGGNTRKRGKSRAYQPGEGSAVHDYLSSVLNQVKDRSDPLGLHKGAAWVPPVINPKSTSLGPEANPNSFYVVNAWAFVWDPMKQLQPLMPTKFECIKCGSSDHTTVNKWGWRPFHWWDKSVYVIHQWVRCSSCKICFPTIGPKCLATLPTDVTEQFPFLLPNLRGPGMYMPMITLLTILMPHSILFGTFARAFNSLRCIQFAQSHASYLASVLHWLENPPAVVTSKVPTPFSTRQDQMGNCGLTIDVNILKSCLRLFMDVSESYMNAAHQLANDNAVSTDDSYKFNKHIYVTVGNEKVKLFAGIYSALSGHGQPVISVFTYTKSPSELNEVLQGWAEVRANVGQEELLRLEGDNAAGDSTLQLSVNPSLSKGVVPYQEPSHLPRFSLKNDDWAYVWTKEGLQRFALALIDHAKKMIEQYGTFRIGLDIEFDEEGVTQLSIYPEKYDKACLIHPWGWGKDFPSHMKTLFELDGVLIIGCNVVGDLHKLRRQFNIMFQRVRDIRRLAVLHKRQKTGLKDLVAEYLYLYISKQYQRANFRVAPPLPVHLQEYAVGDAILPVKIDAVLTELLAGTLVGTHPPDLRPGADIIVKSAGKHAAEAKLVFLGECGNDNAESKMWLDMYIGVGKAMVQIINVIAPGLKLPLQPKCWGPARLTFADVFDKSPDGIIAIKTSQIQRQLTLSSSPVSQSTTLPAATTTATNGTPEDNDNLITETETVAAADTSNTTSNSTATNGTPEDNDNAIIEIETVAAADTSNTTSNNTNMDIASGIDTIVDEEGGKDVNNNDNDNCVDVVDVCDSDAEFGDDNEIRSREKSDIWHEHDGLAKLLKRNNPAAPYIHHLLRIATLSINETEEKRVRFVLSSKGYTNYDEHFFHNKEYWYKRVRMPPRKGSIAYDNLLGVLNYLKSNDAFKESITPEVEKYIIGWAERCQRGRYEELPDVDMYTYDGVDSDGLDLWIRHRGSRAENLHQKMHAAVGPYGIGAETAHNLQVIVLYEYLVHAGIARCGEPDFGHTHLWLEDRIQSHINEIYGVDIFPGRTNVCQYKPLDFNAIGVVPLCLNEDYVEKGEPASNLTGDIRWVAMRQGLKYPPIPPTTKEEFHIIRTFCNNHPNPTRADINNLCKTFKAESNGITIFPKLPPMINPAIKRWKINQEIRLLKLQAGTSYDDCLSKMKQDTVTLPSPTRKRKTVKGKQHQQSYLGAQSMEIDGDTNLARLPPAHVPPLNAPTQRKTVPPASVEAADFKRCFFWPICKSNARVCGGTGEDTCTMYSKGIGTHKTPSMREISSQRRRHTWTGKALVQDCAWGSLCGKAVDCGGIIREKCEKYGTNGTHVHEKPSEQQVKQAKKEKEAARVRAFRQEKRRKSSR